MNSCQSSGFSPSPTVVQSPISPPWNIASSPPTPAPQKDRDPVRQTYPGMLNIPTIVTQSESGCAGEARMPISGLCHSDSFHIEHIPNVKEIHPEWKHDEIDEIMIISPKPKARNSFLDLGESKLGMNNFKVLKVLGKQPSIQTILARSCSDFGLYAIKTLEKRAASAPNLLKHVRSEQACLRIVTEGDCPFLPKLRKSFHDETRLYMVLDTYPGGNIAMHLDREGPFVPDKARFYASEIVAALSFLHSLCIVHRDVKPENVVIGSDGHIVLTNFSCAKILDPCESMDSDCGTREFDAPERILGWAYDYAVDIWSFGVLLCIMHFGQHPFLEGNELDTVLIMQKRILRGQAPHHPSSFTPLAEWNLIKKCLERNAHLRPPIQRVKAHEYFSDINWDRVENKDYPAPYIPYGDEIELLGADEETFHSYDRSDLHALDDNSVTDTDFDGFTFTWDPSGASGDQTAVHITPEPGPGHLDFSENCSGKMKTIRSILKHPSMYLVGDLEPKDIASPSDFLDLRGPAPRIHHDSHSQPPRKLQKKRLSRAGTRSSMLSTRRSVLSMLTEINGARGARRKSAYRNNYLGGKGSASREPVTLPSGIVRTGQGIGFTCNPQASRSQLSLSSTKDRSCFKSISRLFSRHKSRPDDLPRSRGEVLQQIYGSTWSLHTNEAQMSTVSFAMPNDLGRRIDSLDLQVRKSTTSCTVKQS